MMRPAPSFNPLQEPLPVCSLGVLDGSGDWAWPHAGAVRASALWRVLCERCAVHVAQLAVGGTAAPEVSTGCRIASDAMCARGRAAVGGAARTLKIRSRTPCMRGRVKTRD